MCILRETVINLRDSCSLIEQLYLTSTLNFFSRAMSRDEKDGKEGKDGKDSKGHSPKKYRSFRSAPHQSIHAKLQETKAQERSPQKSPQKQRKKLQGHSFDEGASHDGKIIMRD